MTTDAALIITELREHLQVRHSTDTAAYGKRVMGIVVYVVTHDGDGGEWLDKWVG